MRAFTILSLMLIFLFSTVAATAQTRSGVCPGPVNEALQQLGTNCASMGRNTACYGFNNVDAAFNVPVNSDFFTSTDERADLMIIDALKTGPLDLNQDEWGVSLMNVQANLPSALPGQGVVFVLLGGVEVEGGDEPEDATVPQTTIQVNVTAATDLRSAPDTPEWLASNVLDSVPASVTLPADAIDSSGGWVRVVYNAKPGWIDRAAVAEDVGTLTVLTPDSLTPMQAFFFRVGIGGVSCDEVPSMLAVQGPRNVAIDIRVNEVNVRVTSTIVLQTFPPGDVVGDILQLSTISGLAIINPDTPQQIIVPPGYTIFIRFAAGVESLGIEGDADEKPLEGDWFGLRPLTPEELALLSILEGVPGNLLHYRITLPEILGASGVGNVISQLFFRDQGSLDGARRVCAAGLLPVEVCRFLGIT
jgi:hypothetical protein